MAAGPGPSGQIVTRWSLLLSAIWSDPNPNDFVMLGWGKWPIIWKEIGIKLWVFSASWKWQWKVGIAKKQSNCGPREIQGYPSFYWFQDFKKFFQNFSFPFTFSFCCMHFPVFTVLLSAWPQTTRCHVRSTAEELVWWLAVGSLPLCAFSSSRKGEDWTTSVFSLMGSLHHTASGKLVLELLSAPQAA